MIFFFGYFEIVMICSSFIALGYFEIVMICSSFIALNILSFSFNFFFFLHVYTRSEGRKIETIDLCFMRHGS
jgi:hypothetical protein